MSHSNAESSSFDKNLRSLLDAFAMFEKEAGLVLDRFGVDADAVGRVLDILGSLSAEAVRPLAAAVGIADAAAVEALARDVRALLQSESRLRRDQSASSSRLDELLSALESLGSTTAGLADLQARTQDRLDALGARADTLEAGRHEHRQLLDDVSRLRSRIDELESRLAAELGFGLASDPADDAAPAGVRPAGTRRQMPRPVKATPGSHKILEGLPALEPKIRPA